MSDEDKDSKTQEPTAKRLSEAASRGQFARSTELSAVLMVGATLGALTFTLTESAEAMTGYAVNIFSQLGTVRSDFETVPTQFGGALLTSAKVFGPIMVAGVVAAIVAGGLQTGFQLSPKALEWKLERLNPITGFARVISKDVAVRGGIDLLKVVAIALILWAGARTLILDPIFTAPVEADYLGQFLSRTTYAFLGRLIFALGIIAALAYFYEIKKRHTDLMMTHQEVKEEHKQAEGDGLVKGAMRRMARRLMQKQMLAAVPTADVVVTNPTHFAVALKYERGKDQAPVVLAKGENRFALRIKALAAEHGVPVVENRPVARMLYATSKVGEAIPGDLYRAVAEILAFVYRTHRYYFYELRARRLAAASPVPAAGASRAVPPVAETSPEAPSRRVA